MSTDSERDPSTDRLLRAALRPREAAAGEGCLNAETLAAWADGALYGADAVEIESHLADCARCQTVMATFARSEPAPVAASDVAPAVIPFRPRPAMRWLWPVVAGTAAASLLVWTAWPGGDMTAPAQSMARADAPAASSAGPELKPTPLATTPATPAGPARKQPVTARQAESASDISTKSVAAPSPAPLPPPAAAAVSQPVSEDFIQTPPRIIEFGPPDSAGTAAVGGIRRGGGGGSGRGGVVAERVTPSTSRIRWRVLPSGQVMKSTDGGGAWTPVAIDPPVPIVNGSAPSASVCWLVGRGGLVLLSADGTRFTRLTFPETVDLRSITAIDARQATVTTADGRVFTTTDGGRTWQKVEAGVRFSGQDPGVFPNVFG